MEEPIDIVSIAQVVSEKKMDQEKKHSRNCQNAALETSHVQSTLNFEVSSG
jgi:hypothetical protein